MAKLILFNKPFGVLSQFRGDENNDYGTLSDFISDKSLRVAGRLDATSEGLLLLTDDGKVNQRLTEPLVIRAHNPLPDARLGKTYWVQVAGIASDEQLSQLRTGVILKDGKTLPAYVRHLTLKEQERLWAAPSGVGKRAVNSWLSITIFQGKNRQIRRMTAAVGLPCLRLVRVSAHGFTVFGIPVGEAVYANRQAIQALVGTHEK